MFCSRCKLPGCVLLVFAAVARAQELPAQQADAPRAGIVPIELVADFDNGSTIYDHACNACHGETGEGSNGGGPALRNSALSLDQVMLAVRRSHTMPSFDVLSDQQLLDVSTFVKEKL